MLAIGTFVPMLIRRGIDLTVGTERDARAASRAAISLGKDARVHVKLDTGLHRLGFTDAAEALREEQYSRKVSSLHSRKLRLLSLAR